MVCAALGLSALAVQSAPAAELKIFGSRVTRMVIGDIGAQFEQSSGHTPVVVSDVAAVMKRRIESGEPFDLAVRIAQRGPARCRTS
jgi:ABC-type molybdate transport system substrate-binding protein